jgi:hypothetical protein
MKNNRISLLVLYIILHSCNQKKNSNNSLVHIDSLESVEAKTNIVSSKLIVGGVYLFENKKFFTVSKIINIDTVSDWVTFKMYEEEFKTIPKLKNTNSLKAYPGFVHFRKGGFFKNHPTLIFVEEEIND